VIAVFVAGLVVMCGVALDVARRQTRRSRAYRRFPLVVSRRERVAGAGRLPGFRPRFSTWNIEGIARRVVPPVVRRELEARAATKAEASLPGVLEEIARGLRTGASLRQAIVEAASSASGLLAGELVAVTAALERGVPLVDALELWATSATRAGVRLAVAALCLGAETGGAQARAVDGVAATLRERLAVASEVRALTSQTRASMLVIAASPLAFCAFASATDPRTSTFLFRTPVGLACLALGLTLDAVGALWMRRLSRLPA
jgi:tight adherence protein B